MKIERRDNKIALLCDDCELPFALVSTEGIEIQSKHHSAKHENAVTWETLLSQRDSVGNNGNVVGVLVSRARN